jgi:hypothetical protein
LWVAAAFLLLFFLPPSGQKAPSQPKKRSITDVANIHFRIHAVPEEIRLPVYAMEFPQTDDDIIPKNLPSGYDQPPLPTPVYIALRTDH